MTTPRANWLPQSWSLCLWLLAFLCIGAGIAKTASAQSNPNQGPGGPILVLTSTSSTFSKYYAEILRNEGLNQFAVSDISAIGSGVPAGYDVILLPKMSAPLTNAQVSALTAWVNAGGNLIAMAPDSGLYTLLGISGTSATLTDGYLLVDASSRVGNGIASQTLQFHGAANRFSLNGASSLATLYSTATTGTSNPAITIRSVGTSGGKAAAFAYDLATSIVYSRQGNPAWAAQERDGASPIRSNDKFFGLSATDPQPDWVDLGKIDIPQADEQQHLLAKLIIDMNLAKKPLPRFWYLPNGNKAVVIMTGDDHGTNGTTPRFDQFIAASPTGCSVENWECVRATSYMFPSTPMAPGDMSRLRSAGFELGLHVNTGCANFTSASLEQDYSGQIQAFKSAFGDFPLKTQRHHCIAWSDWATGAKVQFNHGMRLDTTYYFWPPTWVNNKPGHFTASAMPMRFADLDGTLIDVYQAVTQMTDESGQSYPFTIDALLDRALGPEEHYGVFTANAHTDFDAQNPNSAPMASAIVASARSRGVPIISSEQMLTWLDGRNSSSFSSLAWSGSTLSFNVVPGSGANGLLALLPNRSAGGVLSGLARNGASIPFAVASAKGAEYATFNALAGVYTATYVPDTLPPTIASTVPAAGATSVSIGTAINVSFSENIDPATVSSSTLELRNAANALIGATVVYQGSSKTATLTPSAALNPSSTYTVTVKGGSADPRIKDLAGNPLAANYSWSFTTGSDGCPCTIWPNSTTPTTTSAADGGAVELGVKFRSDVSGYITGIRFYKGSGNTGTHIGNLWNSSGTRLATANFTNETATGWQQVNFASPVAITANTVYVASYFAPSGGYAIDNSYFASTGVDRGVLHALQNGVSGGNGVYGYASTSSFPTASWQSSNYWVDVVFATSLGPDTTAPTVTGTTPAGGATSVAVNSPVTVQFSEALNATTVGTSTIELRTSTNTVVPASVSYDAASFTATLTPNEVLSTSSTYTVTVKGGTADPRIKDVSGNALAANVTWSFTTAASAQPSTTSIWDSSATPANPSDSDSSAIELGVKFRSDVNGYITGVRFYKGSGNTGTHTGSLWSSSGAPLATATFTNETATGWQQVNFASPVAITANTVYVASYFAPNGRYAGDNNYFASAGVDRGVLHALRDGVSGGNGVYTYGSSTFPSSSWQASNYWVDVVFATTLGPDTTAPTVSTTTPASGATGVAVNSPVAVRFSEAMDPATISTNTIELRTSGNLVSATVSYDPATFTATLTPSAVLATSSTYTVTVKGGSTDPRAKDLAGNALATTLSWSFATAATNPCSANPIAAENCRAGNPASEWDVSGAGDSSIQGFATDISVNRGGTAFFKVKTDAQNYRLDVYRMGYYGGLGARKVATVAPSATLPQSQPNCLTNSTGLIDCGNWGVSASWAVPADAASGIYFAKLVRSDTGGASHIFFVVRDDGSTADVVFQTSDTTWQAYNTYGGNSLYTGTAPGSGGSADGRAYKVSYNRPFNTRAVDDGQDWVFNAEYPMVRWLEANGYDVTYITGVDSDRFGPRGPQNSNRKVFVSVGHDEYWSGAQRANVEAARDAGMHLAFFSGNEVYWKTRWENSIDSSGTPYRTLVCYKETHDFNNNPDPAAGIWTGTWRDPRNTAKDGGRPENALTGTLFMINAGATTAITVPAEDGKLRFWRNTSVASLTAGATATLPFGTLGYEWDVDADNDARPAGLIRLSTTTVPNAPVLQDFGSTFGSGTATHSLTLYKRPSGALVFGAGTVQWAWGLDANHDRGNTPADVRMQQATMNLFADMGAQPTTRQAGLVEATASTDTVAPVSTISSPASGAVLSQGVAVSISGTAVDSGGGVVGGVEVSTDGGTTWRRATGRANWTYSWIPLSNGSYTLKSRAADDSGNIESPGAGVSVTVGTVDATPPTITSRSPAPNATGVATSSAITATFSEALTASTINANTFQLRDGSGNLVSSTLTYNGSTRVATLTPSLALSGSTTYTATLKGGSVDPRVKDLAGNALGADSTWSFTTAAPVVATAFVGPSANAAVTASAGDNNGFEASAANAYLSDGLFAVDTNSGTSTATSCTSTAKDKHVYYGYSFGLPVGVAIRGLEIRLVARVSSNSSTPRMCVQVSKDGGATWTTAKQTATLTTSSATYTLGSGSDLWGGTAWTEGGLSPSNFRVRIVDTAGSTARTFYLDWVGARVTYQ